MMEGDPGLYGQDLPYTEEEEQTWTSTHSRRDIMKHGAQHETKEAPEMFKKVAYYVIKNAEGKYHMYSNQWGADRNLSHHYTVTEAAGLLATLPLARLVPVTNRKPKLMLVPSLNPITDRTMSSGAKWRALVEAAGIQGSYKQRNVGDLIDYIGRKAIKAAAEKVIAEYPKNMDRVP